MKCELPDSVVVKCDRFVKDFNNSSVSRIMRNEFHDKRWKESETELVKVVEQTYFEYIVSISLNYL